MKTNLVKLFLRYINITVSFTFLLSTMKAQIWTAQTSVDDAAWQSVGVGNGIFVAVGRGTGNAVMRSMDGINWAAQTPPYATPTTSTYDWNDVVYGNGLFVAVASNAPTGFVTNKIMTSPDGMNWTLRSSPTTVAISYNTIAFGNGRFVIPENGSGVTYSDDGINWTRITPAAASVGGWRGSTFGNGIFVAVSAASATTDKVMTSSDGLNWTLQDIPAAAEANQWYSVVYGNGVFVAVAINGTGTRIMTSPDGVTWTLRSYPEDNQWYDITFGDGRFVAVAQNGTNRIMTSVDGINWSSEMAPVANQWRGVTFWDGLFLAIAQSGTGTRVMTRISGVMYLGGIGKGDVASVSPTETMSNFWVGSPSSTAWNISGHWTRNSVPASGEDILFSPTAFNDLVPDQARTIGSINFNGSAKKVILGQWDVTMDGTARGVNTSSYFQTTGSGRLIQPALASGASFTFPVGNLHYNPVTITNQTGTTDLFGVRVMDTVYVNGQSGARIQTPHVKVTWDITKGNASAAAGQGVDFTFQWKASQEVAGMADYVLNHHNGSVWEIPTAMGAPTLTGTTDKFFTVPQYQGSFSPFAIGDDPTSPLPISLTSFSALCAAGKIQLGWTTQAEINNAFFHLHRSADLLHWESVTTLPGAGNSNQPLSYQWSDPVRPEGTVYYRLSQEDVDGTTTSFAPVAIGCEGNQAQDLRLFPNPAQEEVFVQCAGIPSGGAGEMKLTDVQGRVWASLPIQWKEGSQMFSFALGEVPSGIYFIQMVHPTITWPAMRLVVSSTY